ncbi:hypothetical protein ABVT39_001468 [Epinephelus coioides]
MRMDLAHSGCVHPQLLLITLRSAHCSATSLRGNENLRSSHCVEPAMVSSMRTGRTENKLSK